MPERRSAPPAASIRPRVCLAASGGGHLHEMLDLRPFWEAFDHFFVTEPTPIAQQLAASERVHPVPLFAFGQVRAHSIPWFLRRAWRNLAASWRAIRAERPDLVISTGAGSVFFAVLFAKLHGAKFILVEAYCRFETPGLFGRMAYRFADVVFVQSERLAEAWPGVEVFDPLVRLGPATDEKEDLGLVTVGTVLPFDRLVTGVAALEPGRGRPSRLIAQVGEGGARPDGMEARDSIDFDELTALHERASIVFCHAGNGSLMTALRAGCRIVAMPRRGDLGEHWDDHQQEIVRAFAARGLIEVAEGPEDLQPALERALARQPERATTDHAPLIARLRDLTNRWFPSNAGAKLPR